MQKKPRIRFILALLLVGLFFTAGCTLATTQASSILETTITPTYVVITITTKEAYDLMQKNMGNPDFVILDVRTPEEFNDGHIAGAINIDYYSPEFKTKISTLDKDKQYLVYCRTHNRSTATVGLMLDLGFRQVQSFVGGITQWIQDGYPTVK